MMLKNIQNFMGKYWLNNLRKGAGAFVAGVTMSIVAVGCMDTDDTMGSDSFIHDGYSMYIGNIDGGFKTETRLCDSIASDNLNEAYLGSSISHREGQINYSLVSEVSFDGVPYVDNYSEPFGKSPKIDSAFVILSLSGLEDNELGQVGEKYTVYVYELEKALPYGVDSTYYSNFEIDNFIKKEPVFSIDVEFGDHIIYKMPDDKLEYAKKFMSLTNGEYTSYEKFREVFKGYYFTTSKASSGSNLGLIDLDFSGFQMYYHNYNTEPDTSKFHVDIAKIISDDWGNIYQKNRSFNILKRDESFKDPIKGLNIELSNKEGEHYVSGTAGYITTLEVTEEIVDQIKDMVAAKGGSKIFVSNATMSISGGSFGVEGGIFGFGAYKTFQPSKYITLNYDRESPPSSVILSDYIKNTIQDYSTYYGTNGSFGGYYNMTTDKYRINVTSLIQGLVNGTLENRVIELAPHFTDIESIGVASFKNNESNPITLKLTYSVIK